MTLNTEITEANSLYVLISTFPIIICQSASFFSHASRISKNKQQQQQTKTNLKCSHLEHRNARGRMVVEAFLGHAGHHRKGEEKSKGRNGKKKKQPRGEGVRHGGGENNEESLEINFSRLK